ncbi:MAG TPA: TonB-dependent receptor [Steroidobacteraceae bacterium]|nr:TonB-dependent receptor [Steroidobacteraceae bacterium]
MKNASRAAVTAALFMGGAISTNCGIAHADGDADQQLEEVTVTAAKLRALDQFTPTGSRLGLSEQELPATLEVIDSDEMLGRGFNTVEQAADSQAGVISGGSPGDQMQFSMRGFTGDQITQLRNGLYIGPANMVNRPENSFNVASVEILKGPASVLYGQGAIAGVVNVVDKGPSFGTPSAEGLLSYGSFNSTVMGVGGTTHIDDVVAFRLDVSRTASDGYVENTPSYSNEITTSATWKIAPRLQLQLSMDYLQDSPSDYFGTPLVPVSYATDPLRGVLTSATVAIDAPMRFVNYNVGDAHIGSTQEWPHLLLTWEPSDSVTIQNYAYYLHAYRSWFDAETYTFSLTEPGYLGIPRIDRDRFFVKHQQNMLGDQGSLAWSAHLGPMPNKAVIGFDYSHLNFNRTRGFPPNDSVDPFEPSPGLFNSAYPAPVQGAKSPTYWNDYSAFFEDVLEATSALKFVVGARYDQLALTRQNFNFSGEFVPSTSFQQTYTTVSERVGIVYDVTKNITPYLSYNTAADPPSTNNIFLVNANNAFALSHSWQIEAGVKGRTDNGIADFTAAIYDIKRDNILTETSIDTLTNVGSQKSKGAELTTDIKLTDNWTVSANAAYTDSSFGTFIDPNTGLDDRGNQPANIPRWTANVWTSYRNIGGLPLQVGGGMRYIGSRYGDEANTLLLNDYALFDFYASYGITPSTLLTARVNNAFDKAYVQWADIYYPPEVMLGAPRYFEVSLLVKF